MVSFELFKRHCAADDFAADDAYLAKLLSAAEKHVVRMTRRSVAELLAMSHGEFPEELEMAVILLGAHWYNQHEPVSGTAMHDVPYTVDALVTPFIRLNPCTPED